MSASNGLHKTQEHTRDIARVDVVGLNLDGEGVDRVRHAHSAIHVPAPGHGASSSKAALFSHPHSRFVRAAPRWTQAVHPNVSNTRTHTNGSWRASHAKPPTTPRSPGLPGTRRCAPWSHPSPVAVHTTDSSLQVTVFRAAASRSADSDGFDIIKLRD